MIGNGADALQKIRGTLRRPDLILIDLKMPVLSGWDFLAVREGDPFLLLIPGIVLSGEHDSPSEIAGDAFLIKPVDLNRLREMVDRILEESNADPSRRPRRTEPWSVDQGNSSIVRNRFGRVAASVASEREEKSKACS